MYDLVKRFFDFLFGVIAILILLPLFIPIVILLKLTDEGEIFYFQERVGYKNRPFKIVKFATMLKASPNLGSGLITLRDDYRVTKMGKFLRMSKINELPQIINIIKGDISFVGPRPLVSSIFKNYSESLQNNIYNVKPGLTGIGSIVFRDEEKLFSNVKTENYNDFYKRVISPYKGKLEIWYQKHRSFFVDFMLIVFTAFSVIYPKQNLHKLFFKNLPEEIN